MEIKNFLMDNWTTSGCSIKDFNETIDFVDQHTKFVPICSDSMESVQNDGVFHLLDYDEGLLKAKNQNPLSASYNKIYSIKGVNKRNIPEVDTAMQEIISTSNLMMRFFSKTYFVSQMAFFTLSQRLGIDDAMYVNVCERDSFISQIMNQKKAHWKLCVREINDIMKVFAVFSDKYAQYPQKIISQLANNFCEEGVTSFGKGSCNYWSVEHNFTEIVISFPDKGREIAEMYDIKDAMPAIRIITSDTGRSSLTFQAIWKYKNSFIVQDEKVIRHQGKITVDNIVNEIEKTLFPTFSKMPEALIKLMESEITQTGFSMKKNKINVDSFIREVSKQIGLTKLVGKKNEMLIRELIESEINYEECITAYDIVTLFMDIPSRLHGLAPSFIKPLQKACGKAPFVKIKIEKADELYLSA